MRKIGLVPATYFVWVIVPVALYGVYWVFGLPHMIWSYDWTPKGSDSFADLSQRHYTRCTYVGPYGPITDHPAEGACPPIRFAKTPEN